MRINSLTCSGYRNLCDTTFLPGKEVNILYGDNGQGKTNLLEALWLFTGEKSFRGAGDHELVRLNAQKCSLSLQFEACEKENTAKLEISSGRSASLNGVSLESAVRLAGAFCAVIFSPEHLGLIKDGPQVRRKFLDAAICQLWPRHAAAVLEYSRALAQRNALLKDIPQHAELLDTLSVWDDKLSRLGAGIIFTRLRYLARLMPEARDAYAGIAGFHEEMELSYTNAEETPYEVSMENAEAARRGLYTALMEAHGCAVKQDLARGFTQNGPHRDHLLISIDSLPARLYGSQGQQRSAVLSLKLAEAAVLRQTLHEPPVLLLDDVMSELDKKRQDYLLNHMEGWQIFITCCDPSVFMGMQKGRVFEIKEGALRKEQENENKQTE